MLSLTELTRKKITTTTLVVGGLHGSGKSVLWKLCQSHPQIVLTDEFHNFLKLSVSYRRHISVVKRKLRKDQHPILVDKNEFLIKRQRPANIIFLIRYWISIQPYRRRLITAEVVESVLHRIFPHAAVVGDVGPDYRIDRLATLHTVAPVVMYRDCRDVAATVAWKFRRSLSKPNKPGWLERRDSAEKVARLWVRAVEMMEQYADKVYTIRYEDMVTNPGGTLGAFGEWLGINPHHFRYDFIHTNDVGRYKRILSEKELTNIMVIAGPTMERLGYL